MPISIQATVVDIRGDNPTDKDVFFVDTNIWYWVAYTRASQSASARFNQHIDYPKYLNDCLNANSQLVKCGLSFSELAHSVERTECEIFNPNLKPKDFRHHYPTQRRQVVSEIQNAWALAEAMTNQTTLSFTIDSGAIQTALSDLSVLELDGYDLFFVQVMQAQNVTQIITDDGDFGTVPGLTVFTANQRLINDATTQGRLIIR